MGKGVKKDFFSLCSKPYVLPACLLRISKPGPFYRLLFARRMDPHVLRSKHTTSPADVLFPAHTEDPRPDCGFHRDRFSYHKVPPHRGDIYYISTPSCGWSE